MILANQDISDSDVIMLILAGDKNAFMLLVKKYKHRLTRDMNQILQDAADLDDVMNETFLSAYKALRNFRQESEFYTWIYRIAVNKSNTLLSRRRSDVNLDEIIENTFLEEDNALYASDNPEANFLLKEQERIINKIINELPENLKKIYLLKNNNHSYEQIAKIMNCPIRTARSRYHRANETIKVKLNFVLDGKTSLIK